MKHHTLALLLVLTMACLASATPTILISVPIDNNVYTSPIVNVEGTVENSLTYPDGINPGTHPNIRCWVYYSVAGKPFRPARTYGSGPDWNAHYGGTGSVAIFQGLGDLPFGTHSVQVYARDQYGRQSATSSRTVVFPQPRIPLSLQIRDELLARINSIHSLPRQKDGSVNPDLLEELEILRNYLGERIGEELQLGYFTNFQELQHLRDTSTKEAPNISLELILEKARNQYFFHLEKSLNFNTFQY